MLTANRIYTIKEFDRVAALPENQDRLLELIHGEIVEKVPTPEHAVIAGLIVTFLNLYLMDNPIGVAGVEARHDLGEKNARIPDVSFIKGSNLPIPEKSFARMPDLAIEIKSPGDSEKAMREKAAYYLANGSAMVWIVFPEKQQIEVQTSAEESVILGVADTLSGGDLLPGFQVAVRKIFRL